MPWSPVERERIRREMRGELGPPTPEEIDAERERIRRTPTGRSAPATSLLEWSLPPEFGIPPADRITHQRIADQAAKAISGLESCGHWRGVYSCPDHGAWAATGRCGHRLCVPCSVARRADLLSRYRAHLSIRGSGKTEQAPMVTATQVSIDGESLADALERITVRHRAFTRAVLRELPGTTDLTKDGRKSARLARDHIGGLSSFEATPCPRLEPPKDGENPIAERWNAHVHILLREPPKRTIPAEWTVFLGGRSVPLNPWRFRFLWATCLLDGRTTKGAAAIAELDEAYQAGSDAWRKKLRARSPGRRLASRQVEARELARWRDLCAALEVPSILDLRHVHPAEGIKYLTKGYSTHAGPNDDAHPLTDWHLAQLLIHSYYFRRTIPWGSLFRLPKERCGAIYAKPEKEDKGDKGDQPSSPCVLKPGHAGDHRDDSGGTWGRKPGDRCEPPPTADPSHASCPLCGTDSEPIPRDLWRSSKATPDTVFMAWRLDRVRVVPRGSRPGASRSQSARPLVPLGALLLDRPPVSGAPAPELRREARPGE